MWTSTDPAEQFWSPYVYAGNGYNPIAAVDDDGNALNPISVAIATPLAFRNLYKAQMASMAKGDDYPTTVGKGIFAFGTTLASGLIPIGKLGPIGEGLLKGAILSGGNETLNQYYAGEGYDANAILLESGKGAGIGTTAGISTSVGAAYGLTDDAASAIGILSGQILTEHNEKTNVSKPEKTSATKEDY